MQFRLLLKLAFVNELLVVVLEARPSGRSLIMARM
jgi:translation initiation factor 2B subunit (eIF-2B alpha/beta/delta family)